METLHIVVADKNPLVRLGFAGIISQLGYPFILREINDADKLFSVLMKEHIQILIISLSFLDFCSQEFIAYLLTGMNNQRLILLKDKPDIRYSFADCEFIEMNDPEKIISRKIENSLMEVMKPRQLFRLAGDISEREKEVLKLVALGFTNKEIADKLFISAHTVITHRKNITSKLGIKTIAGLTVYAVINKLINADELK